MYDPKYDTIWFCVAATGGSCAVYYWAEATLLLAQYMGKM